MDAFSLGYFQTDEWSYTNPLDCYRAQQVWETVNLLTHLENFTVALSSSGMMDLDVV